MRAESSAECVRERRVVVQRAEARWTCVMLARECFEARRCGSRVWRVIWGVEVMDLGEEAVFVAVGGLAAGCCGGVVGAGGGRS